MNLVHEITQSQIRDDIPELRPGYQVRVDVRIQEGGKTRIQAFEGLVIAMKKAGVATTFTVRKISNGVGVERTFPINSPTIAGVTVLRKGKVRRAKLFYMRGRSGKSSRLKEIR